MKIVLSCEHAVNTIPKVYKKFFKGAERILESHRGSDQGALELYNELKKLDITYSQIATTCRLLVDVNRSLYRRTLFSEFTKPLSKPVKQQILEDYYYAFRRPFEAKIVELWEQGHMVLHLSVHSFTPKLNGVTRDTDFGILYHPGRPNEKVFAKLWKKAINEVLPVYRVRFNYPYSGRPDGHVRFFRDREKELYMGLEFEMNQKYARDETVVKGISRAFQLAIHQYAKLV